MTKILLLGVQPAAHDILYLCQLVNELLDREEIQLQHFHVSLKLLKRNQLWEYYCKREKYSIKPFFAPEKAACNLMNCFQ